MGGLRTMLDGGLRPGVYRWQSAHPVEVVRREVEVAGWGLVVLDTSDVRDTAGFLDLCATAFDLPRKFDGTWNALADSLADRSTGAPEVVLWEGWRELLDSDQDTVDVALQVFTEDANEAGQLRVLIREAADLPQLPHLLSVVPVLPLADA